MDQSVLTVKNLQILVEMFRIKNGMSPAIVSDIFLRGTEIITTLRNKMTFLYLLYERYIVSVKLILTTISDIKYLPFTRFPCRVNSAKVKRILKSSVTNFVYGLPHELPNNLGNYETKRKSWNLVNT